MATFLFVVLAGEGLTFTARNPARVLTSRFLLYLLAIGFAGTGLAYRGLNHWREFADDGAGSGGQRERR